MGDMRSAGLLAQSVKLKRESVRVNRIAYARVLSQRLALLIEIIL